MNLGKQENAFTQEAAQNSGMQKSHRRSDKKLSKHGSNGMKRSAQLASPPESPLLPAITEDDLRNGVKLDFVKQFRLGAPFGTTIRDDESEREEAADPLPDSVLRHLFKEKVNDHEDDAGNDAVADELVKENVPKRLSTKQLYDLVSSPDSLPFQAPPGRSRGDLEVLDKSSAEVPKRARTTGFIPDDEHNSFVHEPGKERSHSIANSPTTDAESLSNLRMRNVQRVTRPTAGGRTISTPLSQTRAKTPNSKVSSRPARDAPPALQIDDLKAPNKRSIVEGSEPSPMPPSIPAPPLSMPTYLQLELSSERPSPLYIHRSVTSDFPYESSQVKLDRLKNFMLLPPQLEQVLWFGALACMDAWLSAFTILPLRFIKALAILVHSWSRNLAKETMDILRFIYSGSGRMWQRHRRGSNASYVRRARVLEKPPPSSPTDHSVDQERSRTFVRNVRPFFSKHSRTKSIPSALMPDHKADILRGLLILLSCNILMYFDASRMYHGIRGQAAIKLYVIYNVLEVCDRLFSALGQDVLECLFSKESLERKADGRSKVLRPFWLFILALAYNLVHSTALFYQVITLNVAVNSYSNALLTLLMSNQFVEIKSTVFKKFEKENLFQLTCADVVERFQLWLMLMIIASRNVVETGGLSIGFLQNRSSDEASSAASASILPRSFTLFPSWTGQVLAPFFLVLGSEMLVDWLKHAYINKFNNTKPAIYGRFLDVLAKDYYSNAFADQNLTRRLGLPVIPLACLFIRASVQTYHMFLATYLPPPLPSTATSLSVDSATTSTATIEALAHIDNIFRRALYGPSSFEMSPNPYHIVDYLLPYLLPLTTILLIFLFLLSLKILLGMALLSFARSRYQSMKEREGRSIHSEGRRVGGWGTVEVDEEKRRWIYADDPEGVQKIREREARDRERVKHSQGNEFDKVERYNMIAKRIW